MVFSTQLCQLLVLAREHFVLPALLLLSISLRIPSSFSSHAPLVRQSTGCGGGWRQGRLRPSHDFRATQFAECFWSLPGVLLHRASLRFSYCHSSCNTSIATGYSRSCKAGSCGNQLSRHIPSLPVIALAGCLCHGTYGRTAMEVKRLCCFAETLSGVALGPCECAPQLCAMQPNNPALATLAQQSKS